MKNFIKEHYNKYLWMGLMLIQNSIIILYFFSYFKENEQVFSERFAFILIIINIIYMYIASLIRNNDDIIFRKIICIISFTIWQNLFITSTIKLVNFAGIVMQPVVIYFYTVQSFNLLLYEKVEFKKLIDNIFVILVTITVLSAFVNEKIFYLLYLLLFISLHCYPLIIFLVYRKYFSKILSNVRKTCIFFSIYLLVMLSMLIIDNFHISNKYSNLGWYISISTMGAISYLKVVHNSLMLKIKVLFGSVNLVCGVFFIFSLLWIYTLYLYIENFELLFMVIICSILFLFIIITSLYIIIQYRKTLLGESFSDHQIIRTILKEENIKNDIANYLHDEILQSIIAVKNLVTIKDNIQAENYINHELNRLIVNIRSEIDMYHPLLSKKVSLKENYMELIKSSILKYQSNKKINFNCPEDLIIYPPYDIVVYRFLKELINNSIKYSSGYCINIYIKLNFDVINLVIENDIDDIDDILYGRGLKSIEETVALLDGNMDIKIKPKFSVSIRLPMKGERCYENFIN